MIKYCLFVLFLLSLHQSKAATFEEERNKVDQKVQFDQLAEACVQTPNPDSICDTLVRLKQVGNDAVEAIKEFVPLGPAEYAVLTITNYAITGRLRARLRPLFHKSITNTLDYTRDGVVTLYAETSF